MKLKLERLYKKPTYTIGRLYVNGEFFTNSMELPWLDNQENISCIPVGVYKIKLVDSPKHGENTPELQNVPGRSEIQVHSGSFPKDTLGCILLGKNSEPGVLTESKFHCNALKSMLEKETGESEIEIV